MIVNDIARIGIDVCSIRPGHSIPREIVLVSAPRADGDAIEIAETRQSIEAMAARQTAKSGRVEIVP